MGGVGFAERNQHPPPLLLGRLVKVKINRFKYATELLG